jgi:replicative DNA helicase
LAQQELKDKIPPHNEDAEKAALGAMLLENEAVAAVVGILQPDEFYSQANGKIFKAIRSIFDKGGRRVDIISVCDELRQADDFDAAGGEAYISSLTNVVPTAANISYYVELVQDCAVRRSLITIASKITAKSFDVSETSYQIVEKAQQFIFELIEQKQSYKYKDIKVLVRETIEWMEKNIDKEFTGIKCGFPGIDSFTGGFQKSEMIVIGARPSIGKTALALNMASNMAVHQKIPTAFFSLEMPDIRLTERLLASESNVDFRKIRTMNKVDQGKNFDKMLSVAGKIYDAPLFIEAIPNMKLFDLRTQARRLREVEKVEIIFIDYLGLIGSDNIYTPRYEQVSEFSRSVKSLARELDIPIVVLSQVGRPAEGGKPTLAHLRDSGAVEQDADVVILMHRERSKKDDEPSPEFFETEIEIAKNRNGPTGKTILNYYDRWTKFDNSDK